MLMSRLAKLFRYGHLCRYDAFNPTTLRTTSSLATSNRLNGKVAIVTASTEGIGFAIAKRLAQEGAQVVVSSRKQENVDRAVQELNKEGLNKIRGITCHVGVKSDREKLLQQTLAQFGGIDILVSNAGLNPYIGPVLQTPERTLDKVIEINLKSTFQLTQETVPLLKARGGGSIVYMSSIVGLLPESILGVYSITKTALLSLTRVFSRECAPLNIRVNCIAPGIINTKMGGMVKDLEQGKRLINSYVSLKRLGEPEELGGIVVFLCSDDASYITGETICVTGGTYTRL